MLSEKDQQAMLAQGITTADLEQQLNRFETGFPFLKIHSVASVGNGIKQLSDKECNACLKAWRAFLQNNGEVEKFVPASGAASRMFKALFAFINSQAPASSTDAEKQFFDNIAHFAFFHDLNKACMASCGHNIDTLLQEKQYRKVAQLLLGNEGLNYGALPKALLKFHKVPGADAHTPLEEHLEEGAQYATQANKAVNIHFTVSPEHKANFEHMLKLKVPRYQKIWGVNYCVTLSEQQASTNTIAVTLDNKPYRDSQGNLLFRPAGHGALIENLNERQAQVVFIKNVDNVVVSKCRHNTVRYKKILAGYLVMLQEKITQHLTALEATQPSQETLNSTLQFVEQELCTHNPSTHDMTQEQLKLYLQHKLNRPIRVCGMVKNEGEPGGGPYLAYNNDGSYSPQILESAQIDPNDAHNMAIMHSGTHFNPVDLVCYLKDYKGNKFNLKEFIDSDTGFISQKSKDGVDIKALELPGLWNGAMSDWNTVFIEVPSSTFKPVKQVNDLLHKEHQ